MQTAKKLNPKLKYKFCELRAHVLGWCLNDVWIRIDDQKKIAPTEEEVRLNTIWELIEPQVRDAVKELNRKGYCTTDSGFSGRKYHEQFISGLFKLDNATRRLLESKGVRVQLEGSWTYIRYIPTKPDIDEIKKTWDEIVELIPDLGHPAKSIDEILHFDEDKIMKKLIELGRIKELPKK